MSCLSAHIRFHRVSPSLGLTKGHALKYPPPHRTERGHHRGTHCQPETNHTRNERLNFQGGAWVSLSPWWVIGGGCLSPKPQAPPHTKTWLAPLMASEGMATAASPAAVMVTGREEAVGRAGPEKTRTMVEGNPRLLLQFDGGSRGGRACKPGGTLRA